MLDQDCVRFLQWVLPRLRMRWPGFRKVRRQVCRRLQHRMNELELPGADAYRDYLLGHADEWPVVEHACRVTVSRFNRDRWPTKRRLRAAIRCAPGAQVAQWVKRPTAWC